MLEIGIDRHSSGCWSSELHIVPKKNADWRPCGDYRALNVTTDSDRHTLPNIQNFTANLCGTTIFSKVDLAEAYVSDFHGGGRYLRDRCYYVAPQASFFSVCFLTA